MDIFEAIQSGDAAKVGDILQHDSTALMRRMDSDDYPLHVAAMTENDEIVRVMLSYDCEVDARGFEDRTALHYAVEGTHLATATRLIEAGADVNAIDQQRTSVLAYAAKNCASPASEQLEEGRLFHFLISNGAFYDLQSACYRTDLNRISQLLNAKYDLSQLPEAKNLIFGVIFQDWGGEEEKMQALKLLAQHEIAIIDDDDLQEAIASCEALGLRNVLNYLQNQARS